MKRYQRLIVALLACTLLFGQISGAVYAASDVGYVNPVANESSLDVYGIPLTQEEMEATEGGWGHLITGAIGGAIGSATTYLILEDEPTLRGVAVEAAVGAVWGAATAGLNTVKAVYSGASLAFDALDACLTACVSFSASMIKGCTELVLRGNK